MKVTTITCDVCGKTAKRARSFRVSAVYSDGGFYTSTLFERVFADCCESCEAFIGSEIRLLVERIVKAEGRLPGVVE